MTSGLVTTLYPCPAKLYPMKKPLFLLTIALGLALGGPAFAAGATKEVAPGTGVEMPILIAPMIVDGS